MDLRVHPNHPSGLRRTAQPSCTAIWPPLNESLLSCRVPGRRRITHSQDGTWRTGRHEWDDDLAHSGWKDRRALERDERALRDAANWTSDNRTIFRPP